MMAKNLPINVATACYQLILAGAVPIVVIRAFFSEGTSYNLVLFGLWLAILIGLGLSIGAFVISQRHHVDTADQWYGIIGVAINATGIGALLFIATTPLLVMGAVKLLHPRLLNGAQHLNAADRDLGPRGGFSHEQQLLKQLANRQFDELKYPLYFYVDTTMIMKAIPLIIVLVLLLIVPIAFSPSTIPGSGQAMLAVVIPETLIFAGALALLAVVWSKKGRPVITLSEDGFTYRKHHTVTHIKWSDITHIEARTLNAYNPRTLDYLFICVKNPEQYRAQTKPLTQKQQERGRGLIYLGISFVKARYYEAELPGVVLAIPLYHLGLSGAGFALLVNHCWAKGVQPADETGTKSAPQQPSTSD